MTDCPECNKPLGEAERSCPHCGWPHEEAEQAEQPLVAGEPASAAKPMRYLAIGLGVGCLVGVFIGASFSGGSGEADEKPARVVASSPPVRRTTNRPPPSPPSVAAVRLRELGWTQSSEKLCTGRFEVISAPPSVRMLKFAVTNAEGNVIGNDSVLAEKPVSPGTVLELGFEVGSCSAIEKWQVEVPDNK